MRLRGLSLVSFAIACSGQGSDPPSSNEGSSTGASGGGPTTDVASESSASPDSGQGTGSTTDPMSDTTSHADDESDGAGESSSETGQPPADCASFDAIISLGATGPLGGAGFGIDLMDDRAYVAARAGGLKIVDIADPSAPVISGEAALSDALEVRVHGTLAVVANGVHGTVLVDVTDPSGPSVLGEHADVSFGLRVLGQHALVANRLLGFEVLDISDPSDILSLSITPPAPTKGIDISGDRAYLALEPGLAIFDIADPAAPMHLVTASDIVAEWDVLVDGTTAYAIARGVGVAIVDASDLDAVSTVATIAGITWGIDKQGDRLFVVGGEAGLRIWDVSAPARPEEIGGLSDIGHADAVRVRDNLAFVTTAAGLEVLQLCP